MLLEGRYRYMVAIAVLHTAILYGAFNILTYGLLLIGSENVAVFVVVVGW